MNICGETIIEPARPGDAHACGAIMSDWVDETQWMPRIHTRAQNRGFLSDLIARGWVIVARRCATPVGFLARDGGEIHALYLARSARGQGLGRDLLDRAREQAKESGQGLGLWCYQANEAACGFYLREGFREEARSDGAGNDAHLPDIRYTWSPR